MLRVHVRALNCDPSKSNCVCAYDYIMNLSLSRCTRLHVCCTSSVVLQENQVIVQTGMWSLLAVAKNVSVYHDAQSIGLFVSWFTWCEMLALSVLLLFFHYPTCKDDYRTSQTTVHCKIFTDFVNRQCLQRTRTVRWATQFVLRGWGLLELWKLTDSFAKFYSRKFQCPYFANDLQIFGHENFLTYGIYICLHIQYYNIRYIIHMKVDYLDLVPVVTVGERVSVGLLTFGEGLEGLCGANVWSQWPLAVCLLDSVLCSICHWWLVARCG